jgi:hypothetical protein
MHYCALCAELEQTNVSRKYDEYDYKTAMGEVMAAQVKLMPPTEMDYLEHTIDAYGIRQVLNVIQMICGEKAEHVATNWQDTTLAKRWEDLAHSLSVVNSKLEEM